MFVSHEKNIVKKKFQKPNILRKKTRPPSFKSNTHEPLLKAIDSSATVPVKNIQEAQLVAKKCMKTCQDTSTQYNKLKLDVKSELNNVQCTQANETKAKLKFINKAVIENLGNNNNHKDYRQNILNCNETLKHAVTSNKNNLSLNINVKAVNNFEANAEYLESVTDPSRVNFEQYEVSQLNNLCVVETGNSITTMVPLSAVTIQPERHVLSNGDIVRPVIPHEVSITFVPNHEEKFKCNILDCNKEFCSRQKLNKHKNRHNKTNGAKVSRQISVECPVKKIDSDGSEIPCGKIYLVREELLKHLNEEHTIDDAPHSCGECGRRFFWRSGLCAHSRSHCGRRPQHACAWPGCGRVFTQPCRLREHTRVHTGDKPYPCRHPNCGWSFRTASKLMRHARRHTGERRHVCAACGHAFLRREHLRLHHARYHQPHADQHLCPHNDCHLVFTTASSLHQHMKKVHGIRGSSTSVQLVEDMPTIVTNEEENMFFVSLSQQSAVDKTNSERNAESTVTVEESIPIPDAEEVVSVETEVETGAEEWRAARTHCTWPLAPRVEPVYEFYNDEDDNVYVVQEGVEVERSEGSESNVYTVRSDLFLHGNVLTNEDSQANPVDWNDKYEHNMGEGTVEDTSDDRPADLGILDTHPSIDLMQEELLYADDAAVDESSFRVFLLTGEDLT